MPDLTSLPLLHTFLEETLTSLSQAKHSLDKIVGSEAEIDHALFCQQYNLPWIDLDVMLDQLEGFRDQLKQVQPSNREQWDNFASKLPTNSSGADAWVWIAPFADEVNYTSIFTAIEYYDAEEYSSRSDKAENIVEINTTWPIDFISSAKLNEIDVDMYFKERVRSHSRYREEWGLGPLADENRVRYDLSCHIVKEFIDLMDNYRHRIM